MHDALIDALGGLEGLRAILGITGKGSTLCTWRQRGIPLRYRPHIANYAKRHRIELPPDFLKPFEVAA